MLGAVQTREERTVLDAKEPQQTKDTDGGTEGKHMASPPTAPLHKGHCFSEILDKHCSGTGAAPGQQMDDRERPCCL